MGSGHHPYLVVSFVLTKKYAPYGRFLKGGFGNAICDRGSQAVKKGRIVHVFSGKTQTVQDIFGRGLLNLALGAKLKSLPALKEGETCSVVVTISGASSSVVIVS
ncbi:hypothetical protein TNCV_3277981 [Trichonephila clavipes]|nr:hypothetical protein TNCV_3277981 [Trichonephila clavipes]